MSEPPDPSAALLAGTLRLATAAALLLPAAGLPAQEPQPDVPYVPTPMDVVDRMLELAGPAPADSVYDLGSGDGRIVIRAATRYGAPGVGVELNPGRVTTARQKAREAGVEDLVRFVRADLFGVDVGPATVVTLYLLPAVNRRLRPKLLRELRAGTRVVSHDFGMGEWKADTVVRVEEHDADVHYWVVPADVEGRWRVETTDGRGFVLEIEQKYQELQARVAGGRGATRTEEAPGVEAARLRGDSVFVTLDGASRAGGGTLRLAGRVEGDAMSGSVRGGGSWAARRTSAGDGSLERW